LSAARIPVAVLGGSGYVAGEVVRLLALHPAFEIAAVASASRTGEPIVAAFPHLAGAVDGLAFAPEAAVVALAAAGGRAALVSAAPHGASARPVTAALAAAEAAGTDLAVVDLSADFRFADAALYERLYGHPHPAPERLAACRRSLPEHAPGERPAAVAHPGCFPTAILLAIVPLLARGLAEPRFAVTAVTGSTGSGRTPSAKTHHPERRSNFVAYQPLVHRHQPEMTAFAAEATGVAPEIAFVPVSGPQARGIYATIHGRLARAAGAVEIAAELADVYAGAPFVAVSTAPPGLAEIVGTNRARLGVAVDGGALAVTVALDNLVKGAAGGAVQWLNRRFGRDEAEGLASPGLGWI
jgi:N-acetyl-gamma-glutamyl-phosphate reductase